MAIKLLVLFGSVAVAAIGIVLWITYQLIVKGVCNCACGPDNCECLCGCSLNCPCRSKFKQDGSEFRSGSINMGQ